MLYGISFIWTIAAEPATTEGQGVSIQLLESFAMIFLAYRSSSSMEPKVLCNGVGGPRTVSPNAGAEQTCSLVHQCFLTWEPPAVYQEDSSTSEYMQNVPFPFATKDRSR